MKSTKDTYTGKRFYYNQTIGVTIEGKQYFSVLYLGAKRIEWLHPSRLLKKMFCKLNPNTKIPTQWDMDFLKWIKFRMFNL